MNVFGLVVAYLAGVVTGGMVVFFVRGPVVALFRLRDETVVEPVYVEVLSPEPSRRDTLRRQRPWERVAVTATDSPLPVSLRKRLGRGGAS